MRQNHITHLLLILGLFAVIVAGAFYMAYTISNSPELQSTIQQWGILGMLLVSFLGSINAFLPIPPAAFAPIFLSANFSHLTIIVSFALGAAVADSLSYIFGWLGRGHAEKHHSWLTDKIDKIVQGKHIWILPIAYLYMAFAPLPNEYIMIPLALAGYRYRQLILPLLVGNLIYFSWTVYGFNSFFDWFF